MVKINFVTHLPLVEGSPRLENVSKEPLTIVLSDKSGRIPPIEVDLPPGGVYTSPYQYYIDWRIECWGKNKAINEILGDAKIQLWTYDLDLSGKVVFIKMDAYALGDNLAWMPYVEEFQKKHDCQVICSTFWNDLFIEEYPNIMFVKPNTRIDNVFAQYYIGTHDDTPPMYSPSTYLTEPLQKVAADILGLEYRSLTARVTHKRTAKDPKKICISQHASLDMKTWHGDWQEVVNELTFAGYEVHLISKEPTNLFRVKNKTGDRPIQERIDDLESASYFIGVSSGLSWLAHSLGCHVFLISDFTPANHEFSSNVTRIHGPNVRTKIEYTPIEHEVSTESVIRSIKSVLFT
jgi:autotransporter strand-loop-strand O-heptosyltransferase